eukprot:130707-Rhodomonas_salina.1
MHTPANTGARTDYAEPTLPSVASAASHTSSPLRASPLPAPEDAGSDRSNAISAKNHKPNH